MSYTRREALARGDILYTKGRPCKKGHPVRRRAINGECLACVNQHNIKKYKDNPNRVKLLIRERKKFLSENTHDPDITPQVVRRMLTRIRARAKKKGAFFDLKISDFPTLPTHCPVLGMPLVYLGCDKDEQQYASFDRVDNSLGYTISNIRIISNRANSIKSDASASELRAVLRYVENEGATNDKK